MPEFVRYQAAIIQDDHMLLAEHCEHRSGREDWVIPGGGREDGESEEECVRREMKEETHLDARTSGVPRTGKQMTTTCRSGCAACCVAPSISSPIPGMPNGKPAGVRCVQLTADNRCALFGKPERPVVCVHLEPTVEMCGRDAHEAHLYLALLEEATTPVE